MLTSAQLEDASGGRYIMTGNFEVDVPQFDAVFAALSKQWPQLPEELQVCEWNLTNLPSGICFLLGVHGH